MRRKERKETQSRTTSLTDPHRHNSTLPSHEPVRCQCGKPILLGPANPTHEPAASQSHDRSVVNRVSLQRQLTLNVLQSSLLTLTFPRWGITSPSAAGSTHASTRPCSAAARSTPASSSCPAANAGRCAPCALCADESPWAAVWSGIRTGRATLKPDG